MTEPCGIPPPRIPRSNPPGKMSRENTVLRYLGFEKDRFRLLGINYLCCEIVDIVVELFLCLSGLFSSKKSDAFTPV